MFLEEMYINNELYRVSYEIHSKEAQPIVEQIRSIWPNEYMSRAVERQIVGISNLKHRVDELSITYYGWQKPTKGLAKMYNVDNFQDLILKNWHGKRYCLETKKIQLKIVFVNKIPCCELPINSREVFFAKTYEKDIGEVGDTLDVYFGNTGINVAEYCKKFNLPIPRNPLGSPACYGIVYDKHNLIPLMIKAYYHYK